MPDPALMRSLADRLHEQAIADADDRELTSRTDRRRQQSARESELKQLAVQLVALKRQKLDKLALAEELLNAVLAAQAMKSPNARNRQVGVVRQHLRDMGAAVEALVDHLDALSRGLGASPVAAAPVSLDESAAQSWSERLVREGDLALEELLGRYPHADRQLLRQRVRAVAKAQPPRAPAELERARARLRSELERLLETASE